MSATSEVIQYGATVAAGVCFGLAIGYLTLPKSDDENDGNEFVEGTVDDVELSAVRRHFREFLRKFILTDSQKENRKHAFDVSSVKKEECNIIIVHFYSLAQHQRTKSNHLPLFHSVTQEITAWAIISTCIGKSSYGCTAVCRIMVAVTKMMAKLIITSTKITARTTSVATTRRRISTTGT